jgi:Zn-dependent protease with chaperone function
MTYLLSRLFLLLIVFSPVSLIAAGAQDSRPAENPSSALSTSQSGKAPQTYTLTPERSAQAVALARARRRIYFVDSGWGFLLLIVAVRWQIAPALRDWAARRASSKVIQASIFFPVTLALAEIVGLPAGIAGHSLSLQYGLSVQRWPSWLLDWLKGSILSIVFGALLVALLYRLIKRSPGNWWVYAWLSSVPIVVFLVLITPWLVDPLFFDFKPLAPEYPALAALIERVVTRAAQHIPESRMFVMNASSKLNEMNAYVTGVGASNRIVVWDTTIDRLSTPELLSVFGHEMGHYVLGHVWAGIFFSAATGFFGLFIGSRLVNWTIERWGSRPNDPRKGWAVQSAADWGSLPVLALIFSVLSFLVTPAANAYSRHIEHQADQYGLEVLHGLVPDAAAATARSFQILGEEDLEEPAPSPAVVFWFYTHPPIRDRIIFANTYNPWSNGQSPEFVK